MNFDLRFYGTLFLRRLPWIVAIIVVTTAIGVAFAYSLPPVYRAQARLLVESPQIPDELAASTVRSSAEEIMFSIEQRILTRDNLLALSKEFDLHENADEMSTDGIVEEMRRRVSIYMPPLLHNTGVVTVSFGDSDPKVSADVTNELVDQIVAQNVSLRTEATGGTLAFFEQEVKRLTDEMGEQNARILRYKQEHRDALPESLEYRRTRQSAQQERLLQIDRELAGLRDRRQRLTDIFDRTGRVVGGGEGAQTPEQAQLSELRQQLASALVIYAPENPRVSALKKEVAALEELVKTQLGNSDSGPVTTFDLQMADIDGQIDFLASQKSILQRELDELATSIEATPQNAIELGALESVYENLRVQHDRAIGSLAEARMGDRIEITARGQRIAIIEPAAVPEFRSEPNRKLIGAAAMGGGIILAAAIFVLLELLNRTVRRPVEMVSRMGITPFGTIPYIDTRAEIFRRRLIATSAAIAVIAGPILVVYLLHIYVTPMNAPISAVASKIGLEGFVDQLLPAPKG